MLSSIHPFGERSRNARWGRTVSIYLLASIAGGAVTGLTFGALGELVMGDVGARTSLLIVGVAALVALAIDAGLVPIAAPGLHRQVNERWLMSYRDWVYGAGFGFQLGLGLATIVATMTLWVAWIAAFVAGSWVAGLAIGLMFGATRGLAILAGARVDTPDALRNLHRTIASHAGGVQRMTIVTAALTAATALTLGVLS